MTRLRLIKLVHECSVLGFVPVAPRRRASSRHKGLKWSRVHNGDWIRAYHREKMQRRRAAEDLPLPVVPHVRHCAVCGTRLSMYNKYTSLCFVHRGEGGGA